MAGATIDQPDGCAFTAAVTVDEYLSLVDVTGRIIREGKRQDWDRAKTAVAAAQKVSNDLAE